eukprot:gnl/Spiro4/962_TR509_c0_g1_i1.p1 gnl/Spiro4/962_TR509_c0_g1~~gnl/Spiro4/962_TR509_c0_g1_i1.p1  ORF type:complete len:273 (+),score=42.94 gnl/Spiro4/962_TR509_c0_g1_i1:54-872(+)
MTDMRSMMNEGERFLRTARDDRDYRETAQNPLEPWESRSRDQILWLWILRRSPHARRGCEDVYELIYHLLAKPWRFDTVRCPCFINFPTNNLASVGVCTSHNDSKFSHSLEGLLFVNAELTSGRHRLQVTFRPPPADAKPVLPPLVGTRSPRGSSVGAASFSVGLANRLLTAPDSGLASGGGYLWMYLNNGSFVERSSTSAASWGGALPFKCGDLVEMRVDMSRGTIHFYVNTQLVEVVRGVRGPVSPVIGCSGLTAVGCSVFLIPYNSLAL